MDNRVLKEEETEWRSGRMKWSVSKGIFSAHRRIFPHSFSYTYESLAQEKEQLKSRTAIHLVCSAVLGRPSWHQ